MTKAPLFQLFSAASAIVGKIGTGKTYVAKGIVETLLADKQRVCIIDPTGVWYGLRSGATGKAAGGFAVTIFGGEHADVPINDQAGKTVALAIAERDVQCIIDLSDMTQGQKVRFMTPFLENLYAKNKAPLYLVVDEADEIAAQRLALGEERMFGAFDKIVRRGRVKGFRPLMISQRPAVIHKNVLSQIGTMICLQLTSPQDRKAIEEWVKGNADSERTKEVISSLQTLPLGEGWVWSPANNVLERRSFPKIRTFDSSRTPEPGEKRLAPSLTSVDVAALREAVKVADASPAPSHPAKQDEIAAAEQRGFKRGRQGGYSDGWREGHKDGWEAARKHMRALLDEQAKPEDIHPDTKAHVADKASAAKAIVIDPLAPAATPKPRSAHLNGSSAGADKLLAAIDTTPESKVTWSVAALRAGYSELGGGFRKAKNDLIASGRVVESVELGVYPAHRQRTGRIPTYDELLSIWTGKLGEGAGRLLAHVAKVDTISIDALAEATNYAATGGGFRKALKSLRTNSLIQAAPDGVRVTDAFRAAYREDA